MKKDKYSSFRDLEKKERGNFKINCKPHKSSIAIMSPHGGKIEPGTSEIVLFIAGEKYSYYDFYGSKSNGNKNLHIASTGYDVPEAEKIAAVSEIVLTIHGCDDKDEIIFVGGLHDELKKKINFSLKKAGFSIANPVPGYLAGTDQDNICNKNKSGKGIQIEISRGLRKKMFTNLKEEGRKSKTDLFYKFVQAIQSVLDIEENK